jgi:aminobenzoyl-glutamate utilization protein B
LIVAAVLALSSASSLSAAELSPGDQAKLIGSVDGYAPRISDVALKIWASPELGYQETKTTALLQAELRDAGFAVEAGVAGIPTAFVARAGTSGGPVIAILAEMDALPGMSQAAEPERQPIASQSDRRPCLRAPPLRQRRSRCCGRDQELARGDRHERPDPGLRHAG